MHLVCLITTVWITIDFLKKRKNIMDIDMYINHNQLYGREHPQILSWYSFCYKRKMEYIIFQPMDILLWTSQDTNIWYDVIRNKRGFWEDPDRSLGHNSIGPDRIDWLRYGDPSWSFYSVRVQDFRTWWNEGDHCNPLSYCLDIFHICLFNG